MVASSVRLYEYRVGACQFRTQEVLVSVMNRKIADMQSFSKGNRAPPGMQQRPTYGLPKTSLKGAGVRPCTHTYTNTHTHTCIYIYIYIFTRIHIYILFFASQGIVASSLLCQWKMSHENERKLWRCQDMSLCSTIRNGYVRRVSHLHDGLKV